MTRKTIGCTLIGGVLLGSVGALLVDPDVGATMGILIGGGLGYANGILRADQLQVAQNSRDGGRSRTGHWR
jgi:gas vesicle protein